MQWFTEDNIWNDTKNVAFSMSSSAIVNDDNG